MLNEINFDKKERGGLLPYYIENDEIYFCLMIPSDPMFGGSKPQISKGGLDKGETTLQAAIREAKEELGYIHKSSYNLEQIHVENNITWYCVKVDSTKLNPHDKETKKVVWLKSKKAYEVIRTWQKPMLAKAYARAKKHLNEGTFSIKGFKGATEMVPHHVEMYYDKNTRFWIVQLQTKEGYQIGDAEYIAGKPSAIKAKKELEKIHKL
jgi:8-oxo-dGTP pyrophosphatase MutT (NUDIX family)